jgi:hypothetical protein
MLDSEISRDEDWDLYRRVNTIRPGHPLGGRKRRARFRLLLTTLRARVVMRIFFKRYSGS